MSQEYQQSQNKRFIPCEAILFCIELTDAIFKPPVGSTGRSYLLEILDSLLELMKQLIIIKPESGIGCYLYNSDKDSSENNIYQLIQLRNINIKAMKKISNLVDDVRLNRYDLPSFCQISQTKTPLENLFMFIQEQITQKFQDQKSYNFGRVFLFTNNDSPVEAQDESIINRLKQITADLYDQQFVSITTFFFQDSEDKPFNTAFYKDILNSGSWVKNSTYDGPNVTPISFNAIRSRVLKARDSKRIAFRCSLIISEDLGIKVGVKTYSLFTKEKPGTKYKLIYEHDNIQEEAFSSRKYLHPKTGEIINPSKLCKVFQLGNINIELTEEELDSVNEMCGNKGTYLKIIGFRSTEKCIHYFNNVDKSYFVYPDEKLYVGSTRILVSLFKNLRSMNKVALVWGKQRNSTNVSFHILKPTDERDINEGFFLYRVPFIEEMRKVPNLVLSNTDSSNTPEDDALFNVTEAIVNNFNLRNCYSPKFFRNPVLQKYYNLLHNYLLQQEDNFGDSSKVNDWVNEDDTLEKLRHVRDKILASAHSSDKDARKLSLYFDIWNRLYDKIKQEDEIKQEKRKKPRKSLPDN
ncbi:ATP-dependent DNA helicase YKU70 PWA37_001834 [Arxiozyma heterogenica]|uniref:ATP-dependent DNA helicase YKU70 n=1 Tax=Arxiozyma heterogenica TaxID=278026 RepID=UPI002EE79899